MNEYKLLLVEDNIIVQEVVTAYLTSAGYKIEKAKNGEDCIEKYFPFEGFDLILTDLMMSKMGGLELIKEIRAKDISIPIVVLSAVDDVNIAIEALKSGAEDYVLKGTSQENIKISVKKTLEKLELKKKNEKLNDDLKKKNEELTKANEELVRLDQFKNKYLGIAAHDLRNPLSSIKGYSEILQFELSEKINEEQSEYLELIYSLSENMLSLVNDFLDISVIESGKLVLKLELNSLKEVVEERIRIIKGLAEKKNIKIHSNLSDLPKMSFDSNRIAQVIDNLLTNAIKFSPLNSNIYVSLVRELDLAQISVMDEGQGLKVEELGKLFSEFQKCSATPTHGETSTGLGLSIVKKIIDTHKGAIDVECAIGKGCIFKIFLPMEE